MTTDALRLAVLGDVHGHLTLAFQVLRRWQDETGHALDLILQVGDLGAFPPPFRLDDATRRFAERDPDELGFALYHEGAPEAVEALAGLTADMWFVKGNHEDFVFLDEVSAGGSPGNRAPVPVDACGRIHYLPNGGVYDFTSRDRTLRIAALGGIADAGGPGDDPVSMHYTNRELRALGRASFDLLLSHEPPHGAAAALGPRFADAGSPDVAALLRRRRPALHFCGHYHEPGARLATSDALSYQLDAVAAEPAGLAPGCIAIVTWNDATDHRVDLLEAPWSCEYGRHTWRHARR